METLARAEVEAENLEGEVLTIQANLDGRRKRCCRCGTSSRRVTSVWLAMSPTPRTRSRPSWLIDSTITTYTSDLLKTKQADLKAKRNIIKAAHEQLRESEAQKSTLLAKLNNIEAQLR